MTSYRRYKIWLILLFFSAVALFFLPAAFKKANAEDAQNVAEVDGTPYTSFESAVENWEGGTLKLLSNVTTATTITIEGTRTLDLNGHTLSHATGEGSVLSVRGELTLCGGGEIRGGNSEYGGGLDVSGRLILRDNVVVTENEGCNIYLSNNNAITAEDYTGRAGIKVYSPGTRETPVASGTGEFISDDLLYDIAEQNGEYRLILSPLASVSVEYDKSSRIFPTTGLEQLEQIVAPSYVNGRGVAYPYPDEVTYKLSGELHVGANEITLTATAKRGGAASTVFEVEVVAPLLEEAEMTYEQKEAVYFDSDLETLYRAMNFSITGAYEDGITRKIMRTSEKTAEENGEEYITDRYAVACNLVDHKDGIASGTLYVFDAEGETLAAKDFTVEISKHVTDISVIHVWDVRYLEKSGDIDPYAFTPDLPQGITPIATIDGEQFDVNALSSKIYTVTVTFEVNDPKNYEPISGTKETRLFVYAREYTAEAGGVSYVITREGGISPEWRFTVTDITKTVKVRLGNERKLAHAVEVTFLPGDSPDVPSEFEIRILLPEESSESERLAVIRVSEDGTLKEQDCTRDGGVLVFGAGELIEARFVVTTESQMWLYIILAICFGVLCVITAGVLLWYLFVKKKIVLTD